MKADPSLIQEAWYRLQGWYKAAVDRALPPARAMLKRVTVERVTLYSRTPPPGDNIPVNIDPFAVEDGFPTESEIEWAVKRLRNNGPPARLFRRHFTAHSISASVGTPSSTAKGSMVTGMLSPGGGYPAV